MRYFISIDIIDEDVKENIMKFTSSIATCGDISTVSSENLHITLLFLGEHDTEREDELRSSFIYTCENINVSEFTCRMENVGVFPHMNYIETVWIGAEPRDKISELHMKFSEYMNGENEYDFVPHATVARVRGVSPAEKSELQEQIESFQQEFGTFEVDRVRLKQSELREDGPEYQDVEVYRL
ncbi:MAG: RNA 2',3'-cyclic phosphodiesterase [Candidatus Nanohaloarchaea archaeon]|nr:RNA 2',3'-cyclic phosphodiesterase [Candidatus Nanohaloarchaea archaeon]